MPPIQRAHLVRPCPNKWPLPPLEPIVRQSQDETLVRWSQKWLAAEALRILNEDKWFAFGGTAQKNFPQTPSLPDLEKVLMDNGVRIPEYEHWPPGPTPLCDFISGERSPVGASPNASSSAPGAASSSAPLKGAASSSAAGAHQHWGASYPNRTYQHSGPYHGKGTASPQSRSSNNNGQAAWGAAPDWSSAAAPRPGKGGTPNWSSAAPRPGKGGKWGGDGGYWGAVNGGNWGAGGGANWQGDGGPLWDGGNWSGKGTDKNNGWNGANPREGATGGNGWNSSGKWGGNGWNSSGGKGGDREGKGGNTWRDRGGNGSGDYRDY